jgi:hypothetical protein
MVERKHEMNTQQGGFKRGLMEVQKGAATRKKIRDTHFLNEKG